MRRPIRMAWSTLTRDIDCLLTKLQQGSQGAMENDSDLCNFQEKVGGNMVVCSVPKIYLYISL